MTSSLSILSFNQHWFHLASLLEATLQDHDKFEEIRLFIFDSKMPLMPLDLHCYFPGRKKVGIESPTEMVGKFLETKLPSKLKVEKVDISRSVTAESDIKSFRKEQPQIFTELPNLARYQINGMGVGMAIKSHIVTLTRDSDPSLIGLQGLISRGLATFFRLNEWTTKNRYFQESPEVWICNGRPLHERFMREIAQQMGKTIRYYEIGGTEGSTPERWILHDESPHDRILHQREVELHANKSGIDHNAVSNWISKRKSLDDNPFFREKSLEGNFHSEKPYIVFFTSSEDEVASISSDWESSWGTQTNGVRELIRMFELQNTYNLVIRVHPNQKNKSKNDQRKWLEFKGSKSVKVFGQESDVNSYTLMKGSAGVIVFQSTLGVESALAMKPFALISPSRYDQVIPAPYLKNEFEVLFWLQTLQHPDPDHLEILRMGALKWVNYLTTAGNPFTTIEVQRSGRRMVGFLDGKSLRPSNPVILVTRLYLMCKLLSVRFFRATSLTP